MSDEKTIFVMGAGGDLGHRIVNALLRDQRHVRVGVRGGSTSKHAGRLRRWSVEGVEVVDVDLTNEDSLLRGCHGVHAVVSAVQGGPETIIDGQARLLKACLKTGVMQFMPSDFSEDFFSIPEGVNPYLDARRTFAQQLEYSAINVTHFLNGGFMEAVFSSPGLIDKDAGTLAYWGDGEIPLDFTALDDVASYAANVASESPDRSQTRSFAGDRRMVHEIAADYEAATGRALRLVHRGSVEEGYAELCRMKKNGASPMAMLPLQYLLPMMSGEGQLKQLSNDQYPSVKPLSLREFFKQQARRAATGDAS
jgi:uncharacterized protein YbjT (DUF2867 family)